ncbi:MAG TPA: hypothetical protein DCE47_16475 [Planctomycetaceae bacterium]|nr:hypothetical protein [Planctomycetaceae bacterium]
MKPPRTIHRPPKAGSTGYGLVVPSFEQGAVVLRDAKKRVLRIAWEPPTPKDIKPKNRRKGTPVGRKPKASAAVNSSRALDPGVYNVIGYRVIRHDKAGVGWFVSGTESRGIKRITVVAGSRQKIDIDPAIAVDCVALRTKTGLRILMTITGHNESGLTIFRQGRRIGIEYRVLDEQGRSVAEGVMKYG